MWMKMDDEEETDSSSSTRHDVFWSSLCTLLVHQQVGALGLRGEHGGRGSDLRSWSVTNRTFVFSWFLSGWG